MFWETAVNLIVVQWLDHDANADDDNDDGDDFVILFGGANNSTCGAVVAVVLARADDSNIDTVDGYIHFGVSKGKRGK